MICKCKFVTFWQPFWILAAILEIKDNYFQRNRFLGLENIHLDLFYCFLRHLQAKICKFPEFGGHLGKMANRKQCSTFGVWLQADLDSAAQNLMETIIKVDICLKTRSREISIDRGSDHSTYVVCYPEILFIKKIPITILYVGCSTASGIAKVVNYVKELKRVEYFFSKTYYFMDNIQHMPQDALHLES